MFLFKNDTVIDDLNVYKEVCTKLIPCLNQPINWKNLNLYKDFIVCTKLIPCLNPPIN